MLIDIANYTFVVAAESIDFTKVRIVPMWMDKIVGVGARFDRPVTAPPPAARPHPMPAAGGEGNVYE